MIGLIAAMELEMEGLRALMDTPETTRIAGIDYVAGRIEGREVVTAVSGIGKVSAAMCAQAMISAFHPEAIICTGVAGSLSEKLSIGSVAVASGVVQHDLDTTVFGDPLGYLSKPGLVEIPTDASLRARLRSRRVSGKAEKSRRTDRHRRLGLSYRCRGQSRAIPPLRS